MSYHRKVPMSQKEFVSYFAKRGYTKKAGMEIVNDFIDTMTEVLAAGEAVQFRGFGTFTPRILKERVCVNPKNFDEKVTVPKHMSVKFKAGKDLSNAVRQIDDFSDFEEYDDEE